MAPMPYRLPQVQVTVDEHKALFALGDDGRRQILLFICQDLNEIEGRVVWGLVEKPGHPVHPIPADAICWKDTLEHVDCMTDAGAIWNPHGVIQPTWRWKQAPPPGTPLPAPAPPPGPVEADRAYPSEETWWPVFEQGVRDNYAEAGRVLPAEVFQAGRWFGRTGWDIRDAGDKDAQAKKHLNEQRVELGLPPKP